MTLQKRLAALCCSMVLCSSAAVAHAQQAEAVDYDSPHFYLGVSGGMTGGRIQGNGGLGSESSWSGTYGARAGYRVFPWLAAELIAERYHEFEDDLDAWSVTANAKAIYAGGAAQPYAIVGVGAMGANDVPILNPTSTDPNGRLDATEFVVRPGIGMDVYIRDDLSFGTEAAFVLPIGDLDDLMLVSITGNLTWHFR